jgi:group I intron endonuclease
MPGIYKFTFPNQKVYIGKTKNKFTVRWKQHKKCAYNSNEKGYDALVYRAIRKYGWDNITKEVICECDIEDLNNLEIKYIATYDCVTPNGYNATYGGDGGMIMSEYSKNKM